MLYLHSWHALLTLVIVSTQVNELTMIKTHIYELEARHKQVKQGYEEELSRLRRELDATRQGMAVPPGASPPTLGYVKPERGYAGPAESGPRPPLPTPGPGNPQYPYPPEYRDRERGDRERDRDRERERDLRDRDRDPRVMAMDRDRDRLDRERMMDRERERERADRERDGGREPPRRKEKERDRKPGMYIHLSIWKPRRRLILSLRLLWTPRSAQRSRTWFASSST